MEELTIQSLGFLIGFQEDIKIPWPEPQSLAVILDWSSLKALNGWSQFGARPAWSKIFRGRKCKSSPTSSPSRAHINWLWEVQFPSMTCQCTKKSNLFAVLGWQMFHEWFCQQLMMAICSSLKTALSPPTLRSLPSSGPSNIRGSPAPALQCWQELRVNAGRLGPL